eukprot:3522488-Rhodomonas_salina.1
MAGSFKSSRGPQLCTLCPANTYGPDSGASSLDQCRSCPESSFTGNPGATDLSTCSCDSRYYLTSLTAEMPCMRCPEGARCFNGSCAFTTEHGSCAEGDVV